MYVMTMVLGIGTKTSATISPTAASHAQSPRSFNHEGLNSELPIKKNSIRAENDEAEKEKERPHEVSGYGIERAWLAHSIPRRFVDRRKDWVILYCSAAVGRISWAVR